MFKNNNRFFSLSSVLIVSLILLRLIFTDEGYETNKLEVTKKSITSSPPLQLSLSPYQDPLMDDVIEDLIVDGIEQVFTWLFIKQLTGKDK